MKKSETEKTSFEKVSAVYHRWVAEGKTISKSIILVTVDLLRHWGIREIDATSAELVDTPIIYYRDELATLQRITLTENGRIDTRWLAETVIVKRDMALVEINTMYQILELVHIVIGEILDKELVVIDGEVEVNED